MLTPKAHLELSQTSTMEVFAKIVHGLKLFTVSQKKPNILDVCARYECTSEDVTRNG